MTELHPRLPLRQRGLALLILLALLGITVTVLILRITASATDTVDQDLRSVRAMGAARQALIARAVIDQASPGSLPCPDVNNDGVADPEPLPPGGACAAYIGRLPWQTLGLPDLRDGYGERLWYVLSPNFRRDAVNAPINSDTPGQLTLTGLAPLNNVIAIVFAPGPAIGAQQRDAANQNTVTNYLEGSNATGSPGPPGNLTYDGQQLSGTFNDRLLPITSDMLFPEVERRVAREARNCLQQFSQQPGANNRYPWAAPLTDTIGFADSLNQHQGRIPSTLFNTNASLGTAGLVWVPPCLATTWWNNWRELLLYQVSTAYEPDTFAPLGCGGNCLTVNGVASAKFVVIVAGRWFASNPNESTRPSNKTIASNYLELDPVSGVDNSLMNGIYVKAPERITPAANFNDRLECVQEVGTWPC
jgi:hypothetical protein